MGLAVLAIRADVADLRLASRWLELQGIAFAIPPEQIARLDLCLNEALANIIEHGGRDAALAPVSLSMRADSDDNGGYARLTLSDAGRAFNPLTAACKAKPDSLAQATPGGLGLGLMRSYASEVVYKRRRGRNCIWFIVRWTKAA